MLLTTEGGLFTERIYLIGIITEMFCVSTVRYELKLYIVFRLIFICKMLISSVYDMTLHVSIGHIIFSCTFNVIVYSVSNRPMTERKIKIKCTYV